MKCWKVLEIKVEIAGGKGASPEVTWVLGGDIEIRAVFLFLEVGSINFTLEKLSRTQMLSNGKNKK